MEIKEIKKAFDNYAKKFDLNDYDIAYKYRHSYRVKEISKKIAASLNLDNENIFLAETIGLLHDIGRFKQLELYDSYSDLNIDHGTLGVKLLFEENKIKEINIEPKYYDIIAFALENHNKLEIEKTNDEDKLLHAKIIRDADKIDIFRAYTTYKDYQLNDTSEPITKEVKLDFFKNKQIKNTSIKNVNDDIIQTLSFIYDINYKESLEIIKCENMIDKLYETLEQKDLFKTYFEHIKNYINERID